MDKEKIELTSQEGAIVIRENNEPEIYAPITHSQKCDNVRFTLAFMLYAVEQEDWVMQFQEFIDSIDGDTKKGSVEHRRSNFKVIDGDKE
tara:strand:- start:318 stop:587 length:270 start_codon:yes stop_codon:yes gene_type:complete